MVPKKISVLPNVVGHSAITLGLLAVPARKSSTAAHAAALRESFRTANTREPRESATAEIFQSMPTFEIA
jgi:hypothetical protein